MTTTVYEYEKIIVSLATYYCTLQEGTPRLTEQSEIRWVPAAELREMYWTLAVGHPDRRTRDPGAVLASRNVIGVDSTLGSMARSGPSNKCVDSCPSPPLWPAQGFRSGA